VHTARFIRAGRAKPDAELAITVYALFFGASRA